MPQIKIRHSLNRILQAGTIVFLLIVAAKFLNFFKKILIGNMFGISWVADSFFAASYLPYYTAVFFEGIVYLGILPLFSRIATEKGEDAGKRFLSGMFPWILFLTGLVALVFCWGAPWIVREMVPGFRPERLDLTENLFRVMSFVVVLIASCSFFQSLNSYFGRYAIAASSGFVDSFVMISLTLLMFRVGGIFSAAWASVAGALTALIVQAFSLFRRYKIFSGGIRIRFRDLFRLLGILFPLGMIWVFQMLPLVILNRFGSGMWQGTISSLAIAQGIIVVPTALVSQTVLISVFPSLARQVGEGKAGEAKETFFQTLRAAFFILIPAGFLLSGLAVVITSFFFSGQGIDPEGSRRIANALTLLGWGTFAFYADLFMTQTLVTMRRILPAILLCVTRALLMYGFSYFFCLWWDYRGLALSFSLSLAINYFVLFPLVLKLTPLVGKWRDLSIYILKLVISICPLFFSCMLTGWLFFKEGLRPYSFFELLELMGLFSVGVFAYVFSLSFFKIEEFYSISRFVKSFWARTGWWMADTSDV